jgi:hypothetical protein
MLAAVLATLIAVSAAAQSNLRYVEEDIAKARFSIPAATDASMAELETYVREKAKKSELEVTIAPGPTTRLVPNLELRSLDLSARGDLEQLQLFALFVSTSHPLRLTNYETLQLTAQPNGQVGFRARLAMACWVDGPLQQPELTLAAIRKLEDRDPERPAQAIGDVERALREHAIALTELSFGEVTRISGVLLGTPAREALRPALESAFRVDRLDFTPRGDCQAFTATMELLIKPPPEKPKWVDADIFDADAEAHCARSAADGGGKVTMRLRNAAAADVFRVLNAASDEDFVVGPKVTGRFDVDFDHATAEAAVAALREAGVVIGPGPLHLVGSPAAVAGDHNGEAVDLEIHAGQVRDVVRTFETISGRKLDPPPATPTERVSLFVTNQPWDRVLAGIKMLAHDGKALPSQREWWDVREAAAVAAGDLTLAGVAETEKGWVAYAYPPGARKLLALAPATKLRDAAVASVDASGVTLDNGAKLMLR